MIPFPIPKAKDQPDLLQKIHSSAATSKIIPSPSWQIASEETTADSSNMLRQSKHHLSLKSDTPYITKTN